MAEAGRVSLSGEGALRVVVGTLVCRQTCPSLEAEFHCEGGFVPSLRKPRPVLLLAHEDRAAFGAERLELFSASWPKCASYLLGIYARHFRAIQISLSSSLGVV